MTELWGIEMEGRSVLDIGGYNGSAAKAALEAGARTATVLDNGQWQAYGWGVPGVLDERIIYQEGDFLACGEPADIIICGNVLYHLRDPFAGLGRLRQLTKKHLVIWSRYVSPEEADSDGWAWYPDGSGHENGTVWCSPTKDGLKTSLIAAGFTEIEESERGPNDECAYVCKSGRA